MALKPPCGRLSADQKGGRPEADQAILCKSQSDQMRVHSLKFPGGVATGPSGFSRRVSYLAVTYLCRDPASALTLNLTLPCRSSSRSADHRTKPACSLIRRWHQLMDIKKPPGHGTGRLVDASPAGRELYLPAPTLPPLMLPKELSPWPELPLFPLRAALPPE
jgi:hypothetical protein